MAFWSPASITDINEGTLPNDGTGDSIRAAFLKVDDNFTAISNQLGTNTIDFLNANISSILRATVANVGNLVLGNVSGTVRFYSNINMHANIVPAAAARYDLGTPDLPFKNIYAQSLITTVTISNESDDPLFKINANNIPGDSADVGIFAKFDHPSHVANSYAFFGFQHESESFVYKITDTDVTTGNSVVYDGVYGGARFGNMFISNATPSTSNVTGALRVTGGIGCDDDMHVFGNIYSRGHPVINTNDLLLGLGVPFFNGGVVVGNVVFTSTTPTLSANTGAVVVFGGMGVGGNIIAAGLLSQLYGNVRQANQPYITDLGTLNSLTVANTTQSNVFSGLSIGTTGASFTNLDTTYANVTTLVVTSTITTPTINAATIGNTGANIVGTVGTANQPNITTIGTFANVGIASNLNVAQNIYANNIVATNTITNGVLTAGSDINITSGKLTVSADNTAITFNSSAGLSDALIVASKSVNSFNQIALHNPNTGSSASADFIAYADTGDNSQGFIDMGIASTAFSDVSYGITKPGDGYIFLSAPAYANTNPTGGNLVLATADGAKNDIVFAAGGFVTGTEQGRFILNDGLSVTGNLISQTGAIYQGTGAKGLITTANATTTLSTTANASTTTITVASTAGFLVHGALYIENELMYYTSKTSTQFTGITRGTSGTTAASHTAGKLVYQPNAGLTNASAVMVGNSDSFVQVALKNLNSGTSASTDMICYASNGDNDSGWIDMGITGETFADLTYGVTGPDDGYIFMSAPAGTIGGGSLFLSTSDNGTDNDIVFSTNGFEAGTERVRIVGKDRVGKAAGVEVNIATVATSTTTGALRVTGGMGLQGNLYVGGNFNLVGNITIGGTGSTTSTSTLVIENPISFLANANNSDLQDIGIVGQYNNGANVYTGVVRDRTTKSWRFFDGLATKPTTTVAFAGTTAANVYAGSLYLANTTVSSSTTTGALVVRGGVGVGGKLYVGGEVTVTGSIVPTANLTYNLGSPSSWFNTFYGVSTQAQYADLAEKYRGDGEYDVGTVVIFGGREEITVTVEFADTRVAGVVSDQPAYLMNAADSGTAIALRGKVPVKVIGPVSKGDCLVTSDRAGYAVSIGRSNDHANAVFAKSLEDNHTEGVKLVNAVIV